MYMMFLELASGSLYSKITSDKENDKFHVNCLTKRRHRRTNMAEERIVTGGPCKVHKSDMVPGTS